MLVVATVESFSRSRIVGPTIDTDISLMALVFWWNFVAFLVLAAAVLG